MVDNLVKLDLIIECCWLEILFRLRFGVNSNESVNRNMVVLFGKKKREKGINKNN